MGKIEKKKVCLFFIVMIITIGTVIFINPSTNANAGLSTEVKIAKVGGLWHSDNLHFITLIDFDSQNNGDNTLIDNDKIFINDVALSAVNDKIVYYNAKQLNIFFKNTNGNFFKFDGTDKLVLKAGFKYSASEILTEDVILKYSNDAETVVSMNIKLTKIEFKQYASENYYFQFAFSQDIDDTFITKNVINSIKVGGKLLSSIIPTGENGNGIIAYYNAGGFQLVINESILSDVIKPYSIEVLPGMTPTKSTYISNFTKQYFSPEMSWNCELMTGGLEVVNISELHLASKNYIIKIAFNQAGIDNIHFDEMNNAIKNNIIINDKSLKEWSTENPEKIVSFFDADGIYGIYINADLFRDGILPLKQNIDIQVKAGLYFSTSRSDTNPPIYVHKKIMTEDSQVKTLNLIPETNILEFSQALNSGDNHLLYLKFSGNPKNATDDELNLLLRQYIFLNDNSLFDIMKYTQANGETCTSFFDETNSTYIIYIGINNTGIAKLKIDGTDKLVVKKGALTVTTDNAINGVVFNNYSRFVEGIPTFTDDDFNDVSIIGVSSVYTYLESDIVDIYFDKDISAGYLPHFNSPIEWLRLNLSMYYFDSSYEFISNFGISATMNNLIMINGKTLLEYAKTDKYGYNGIYIHVGYRSANSISILFHQKGDNKFDFNGDYTIEMKSGIKTPLAGITKENFKFIYDKDSKAFVFEEDYYKLDKSGEIKEENWNEKINNQNSYIVMIVLFSFLLIIILLISYLIIHTKRKRQ